MSIPTAKVTEIGEAAQALSDAADELVGYREDPNADREDKANANDDFEAAIRELVATLPKKMRPQEV